MALLRQRTHKDLATRIVQTVLRTGTHIQDASKATALFRCALVQLSLCMCHSVIQEAASKATALLFYATNRCASL